MKVKTGIKAGTVAAVAHYLECEYTQSTDM